MFVGVNCVVRTDQRLEVEGEAYRPVGCAVCGTEIAVQDEEEVFHFFNVLEAAAPA